MEQLTKQQRTFISNIQKRIGKTVFNHNLIEEGDKILLDALSERRNGIPFKYELAAVHITTTHNLYEADIDFMRSVCEKHNIPFEVISITIDLFRDPKMSACFVCSWNRRTELFKYTNRNGFNKLAFGHHMNDAVETLLMNMAFNGEISSMPHKVEMFKGKFNIIRPLLEIEEKDLIKYSKLKGFNKEKKPCKYATISNRQLIRECINDITKVNKSAVKNLYRSMNKILPDYIPEPEKNKRKKEK